MNGNALTAASLNAAMASKVTTPSDCQSEMRLLGEANSFIRFMAPPPNALRRFIWRALLGVQWVDLRPENELRELGKLR